MTKTFSMTPIPRPQIWRGRENKRLARIKAKHNEEVARLKRKINDLRPYDDVIVDGKIDHLKKKLRQVRVCGGGGG